MKFGTLALVALAAVLGWFAFSGFTGSSGRPNMQAIENQVADDQVAQYNMTVQDGTSMEVCVHAQTVAAAYLQAKDELNYSKWELIQGDDCRYAKADAEGDFSEKARVCKTAQDPKKYAYCRVFGLPK